MTHRLRVVLTLVALVLCTTAATWFMVDRVVLGPLISALVAERVETAVYMAREMEESPSPGARAWQLAAELGVDLEPVHSEPQLDASFQEQTRGERAVLISRDPASPLFVPLPNLEGLWGMSITFPVDLHRPPQRLLAGFPLVALALLLLALLASRWVLRPLDATSRAMEEVAAGNLDIRVPEGADAAGRMGETFNHMAERVERLVRGQRRLMAAVSHEVRTPLSRMLLTTELLRERGADPARLATLEEDIAEMDSLLGELMEAVRLEEGVVQLSLEPVDMGDVLKDALAAVDMGERPVETRACQDLRITGDYRRLRRAMVNLLANVARHTPEGSPASVNITGTPDHLRVVVEDWGPGIPRDDLPNVFEPFFRAEPSRARSTGGVGLGLMLVRHVVSAHGGSVWANNVPGAGLQVGFELPRQGPAP